MPSPPDRQTDPPPRCKYAQPETGDTFRVAVLGATGSVGTAACHVIAHLNQRDSQATWQIWAASGHRNLDLLASLVSGMQPTPERLIFSAPDATNDSAAYRDLASRFDTRLGAEELVKVAQAPEVDIVVASIVGRAGLESTLAAVEAGKRVALANKETMVVAGPLVRHSMQSSGAHLLPVDSEHSAIFQCFGDANASLGWGDAKTDFQSSPSIPANAPPSSPRPSKLILTASGGPFRTWSQEQIEAATPASALAHPTWDMGQKISIDSATMMNKALEIIEARWLFDWPADQIEVVVHPQSIIHSMVEFEDGSVISQMSPPDMRLPIQYALTYPRRLPCTAPALDRSRPWDLTLEVADRERFPALDLGFEVAMAGGTAGVVVNAANEEAVGLFLNHQISFTDIVTGCQDVLAGHTHDNHPSLARLLELDTWARAETRKRFQID